MRGPGDVLRDMLPTSSGSAASSSIAASLAARAAGGGGAGFAVDDPLLPAAVTNRNPNLGALSTFITSSTLSEMLAAMASSMASTAGANAGRTAASMAQALAAQLLPPEMRSPAAEKTLSNFLSGAASAFAEGMTAAVAQAAGGVRQAAASALSPSASGIAVGPIFSRGSLMGQQAAQLSAASTASRPLLLPFRSTSPAADALTPAAAPVVGPTNRISSADTAATLKSTGGAGSGGSSGSADGATGTAVQVIRHDSGSSGGG